MTVLYFAHTGDDRMLKDPKAEHLLQQISVAYNDPEVAKDQELETHLLHCAQELAKYENYLLTAPRVNALMLDATRKHMQQPIQAINTLYSQTTRTSEYYWGVAAATILGGTIW